MVHLAIKIQALPSQQATHPLKPTKSSKLFLSVSFIIQQALTTEPL